MNEQEVWVRMMLTLLSTPTECNPIVAAGICDAAVAEWRKRYGAKEQPLSDAILRAIAAGPVVGECKHTTVIDTMPPMCAKCGKQLEDAPAPFKVGDRVRHRDHNSEPGVVMHVGRMVTVQWDRWLDTSPESPKDLILDEQETPCAR